MIDIPESSRIPQEWEISFDLKVLIDLMKIPEDLFISIIVDIGFKDVDKIKKAMGQRNKDIDIMLLYVLYYFANNHWLANSTKEHKSQLDIDKVTCTRRLRDACDKEVKRRSMMF